MSNAAKRKGTMFESLVRDYLRAHGIPAERMPAGGAADRGDLAGVDGWTLECKNYSNLTTGARVGLADLDREQQNAGTPHGAVILKRHGTTDPARQLVLMDLARFTRLLVERKSQA